MNDDNMNPVDPGTEEETTSTPMPPAEGEGAGSDMGSESEGTPEAETPGMP